MITDHQYTKERNRHASASLSARRERCIVASILCAPDAKWGPNISTAIAYATVHCFWDDATAAHLAQAIGACVHSGRPPTPVTVAEHVEPDMIQWLSHPDFGDKQAIPMALAEVEALTLVKRYLGKRFQVMIGAAWNESRQHPERVRDMAAKLKVKLEEFL